MKSYRCLHPEVSNYHEEPVRFVYEMIPGTSWFQFHLIHKKGKENNNADALSRSSHMAEAPTLEENEYAEFFEPVIKFS